MDAYRESSKCVICSLRDHRRTPKKNNAKPTIHHHMSGYKTPSVTDIQREVGNKLFAEKRIPDPIGCVNSNGRPIFDASLPFQHTVTEKEMKDGQKLAYRTYALWKTSLKVERRDNVYQALTAGEYSNYSAAHHFLGTPYPVIEPHPHIYELFVAIRWYEHIMAVAVTSLSYQYLRSKPTLRYSHLSMTVQKAFIMFIFMFTECGSSERAYGRLIGTLENEAECHKFGVVETRERLEKKVEYWTKFTAMKAEWMRRWDYHVWGQRPGERYGFLSACMFPPYPPMFGTKVDFPMRKNPFLVSAKPLSAFKLEPVCGHWYPENITTPVEEAHPEFKYLWRRGRTA